MKKSELIFQNGLDRNLTPDQKEVIMEAYISINEWRNRVLESNPLGTRRAGLIKKMYENVHEWSDRIDDTFGRDRYFGAVQPSLECAASLSNLLKSVHKRKCLEIGAGGGSLCWALANEGWSVTGIDLVKGEKWSAITTATRGRAQFQVGDFMTMENPGADWDLIVMEACLEHIPPGDYEEAINKTYNILRPGGWIFINFPNALIGPIDISRYFVKRGGMALAGHFNERSLYGQARDLKRSGFKRIMTIAFGGDRIGYKYGWSRLWYFKARLAEAVFGILPAGMRPSQRFFEYLVPPFLVAQK